MRMLGNSELKGKEQFESVLVCYSLFFFCCFSWNDSMDITISEDSFLGLWEAADASLRFMCPDNDRKRSKF